MATASSWVDVVMSRCTLRAEEVEVHTIRGYAQPAMVVASYMCFTMATFDDAKLVRTLVPGRYVGWLGVVAPATCTALPVLGESDDYVRISLQIKSNHHGREVRLRLWDTPWVPAPFSQLIVSFAAIPPDLVVPPISMDADETRTSRVNSRIRAFHTHPLLRQRLCAALRPPALPVSWEPLLVSEPQGTTSSSSVSPSLYSYSWALDERRLRLWFRVQMMSLVVREVQEAAVLNKDFVYQYPQHHPNTINST